MSRAKGVLNTQRERESAGVALKPGRRGFLAGIAALGTVAASAPVAAAGLPGDDARLVELGAKISALRVEEKVAVAECSRTHGIYQSTRPAKPRTLLWRAGDPVPNWEMDQIELPNGSRLLWCNPWHVRALAEKKRPFVNWIFTGTAEESRKYLHLEPEDAVGLRGPVKGAQHLFKSVPDTHMQKRADDLVKAQTEWDEADERARQASGYEAADHKRNLISEAMSDAFDEMLKLRPSTLDGYRALALAIVEHCWTGEIDTDEEDTSDNRGLKLLVSCLTGVPIEEEDDDGESA